MWWCDVFKLMALSAYQGRIWLDGRTPKGVQDYQWMMRALEAFEKE
jgi:hypothetical protein